MTEHAGAGESAGRTWRTFKNSLYGVIEYAWPIIIALFSAPFIVHRLGEAGYGVLAIVGVSLGFLGFLDLGIGAAATRQVAVYYEREDHANVDLVVGTSLAFYLAVGAVGGLLTALAAGPLVGRLLSIPPDLQPVARMAFYISAAALPLTLAGSAFAAIPRALQRFDVTTRISVLFGTLGTVSTVLMLLMGKGLLGVMIAGTILSAASVPVNYIMARRLIPNLRLRPAFNLKMFRELFSFGGYYLLSTLAVMLLYQLDKLLVSSLLGVAAVTYYVVPGNMAQKIQGLAAAAVGIVFPVSAALHEAGDKEALWRLYDEGTRMLSILVVSLAVPLAIFAHRFLNSWMGSQIGSNSWVAMIFLVGTYMLLGSTGVAWSIANGAGLAWINASFTLGLAVTDIALFFVLIGRYGVAGAAAAFFISALVGVPLLISYSERRVLGKSGFEFLRTWSKVGLVGVAQACVALILRLIPGGLLVTLFLMAMSVAGFYVLYWAFGLLQEGDRRLISLLVRRLRG